jgi:hypothetical protein
MTAKSLTAACQLLRLLHSVLVVHTKSESISSRDSNNQQGRQAPDDGVRSQRGAEGLSGDPKLGEGQYTLSSGFSDPARESDDDRDHVAERCKRNEEVQPPYSTAITEDFAEEQCGCGELRALEFFFGHWELVSQDVHSQ